MVRFLKKNPLRGLILTSIYVIGIVVILASGGGGGGDSSDDPEFDVTVSDAGIKTIRFDWASFNGSTNYKLFINPDGASGYSLLQDNLVGTSTTVEIEAIHFTDWVNASYILEAHDNTGYITESSPIYIAPLMISSIGYIKASNTDDRDLFGGAVSLSAAGNTLAVGAPREFGNATGIDGDQADNSLWEAGAVYVFTRSGSTWTQQAYVKASNTGVDDYFGGAVSLSADGNTLAVGARGESSNATGIDGDQADNSALGSGAVYVFTRSGSTWTQQAYVKASNTENSDRFGSLVSLSADGNTLAVGAVGESSNATGIDGNQADNSAPLSGAVYVFTRSGNTWTQQAYVKASNTGNDDRFGGALSLSAGGNTLAVGAGAESSNATGIDGNQADNSASWSGAVYVFTRSGNTWTQQAYVKASNTDATDWFGGLVQFDGAGNAVSLSADGNTLAVGAYSEGSNATGIDGDQADNSADTAGAVYVFTRSGSTWTQQAYVKASNTNAFDSFGFAVNLSTDGDTLAVGARGESSNATGIDGNQADDSALGSGAVYVFTRSGSTWTQQAYVKASNTDTDDRFGLSKVSLSADGDTLAVGAYWESSNATGIDGDQADNSSINSGAVYIY
jgi:hypothetical protein